MFNFIFFNFDMDLGEGGIWGRQFKLKKTQKIVFLPSIFINFFFKKRLFYLFFEMLLVDNCSFC